MLERFLAPLLLLSPALAQASFQGLGAAGQATGISSDGQFVVGLAAGGTFRWDATNGMQTIVPLLSSGGNVQCASDGQHGCNSYVDPVTGNEEAARWDA